MWDWNSGFCPAFTRSWLIAISGRTKASSLSFGQWSVCSATLIEYFSATTCANSARALAPVTMSFTDWPEPNSAPPVENWMIPSLSASAKPRSAALIVSEDVQLMAGKAKALAFARSSISL